MSSGTLNSTNSTGENVCCTCVINMDALSMWLWCGFSDATLQKMLAVLAQCETTMKKSVEVYNMNLKEQENYERLNERIGKCLIFICSAFLSLVNTHFSCD